MFCNKCGKELKEGTRFCPRCGKEISATIRKEVQRQEDVTRTRMERRAEKRPKPPGTEPTKPEKKNVLVPIIIVMAVLIFVGSCVCGFLFFANGSKKKNTETKSEYAENVDENKKNDDVSGENAASLKTEPEVPTSSQDDKGWALGYKQLINNPDSDFQYAHGYALIYLDDNDIPEIITDTENYQFGYNQRIATYKNGSYVELGDYLVGPSYIERSGLILSDGGRMGNYPFTVYKLDDGKFNVMLSGGYYEGPDENGEIESSYHIGELDGIYMKDFQSTEVSEEEYNSKREQVFDSSKATSLSDYYGPIKYHEKEEFLEMLDEYEVADGSTADKQESGMSEEEMYRKMSDLFCNIYLFDGTTYVGFLEYNGDPQGVFYVSGDTGWKYEDIVSFENNVVTIRNDVSELQFRFICPWKIEAYLADGSPYLMMDGDASSINAAMSSGEYPEYVWQDSDSVSFEKCVMGYQVCRLARNEIYARYGRKFRDEGLQAFFNSRSWYNGSIETDDFDQSVLNDTEKANVKAMKEWEEYLETEGETN